MNKPTSILLQILFLIIALTIIGLVAGHLIQGGVTGCTELGCLCPEEGEVPCNTCQNENPVFVLGIMNIIKVCHSKEILTCENNQETARRYDITGECKTEVKWFDFVLNYMK